MVTKKEVRGMVENAESAQEYGRYTEMKELYFKMIVLLRKIVSEGVTDEQDTPAD